MAASQTHAIDVVANGARMKAKTKPKRRRGRPAYKPTDEQRKQVGAMVAYGIKQAVIADVMGIDETTLRKYYAPEIATAREKANAAVAQSLYNEATKGSGSSKVTAAIFWLKTQAGWKETTRIETVKPHEDALDELE